MQVSVNPLNGISKRYKQSLKKQTSAKALLKRKKLTIKKIFQKIDEWNVEIEGKLEIADKEVTRLKQWLADAERNEKFVAQEKLFKLEMEMHEKKLKIQAELCVSKKNPETWNAKHLILELPNCQNL